MAVTAAVQQNGNVECTEVMRSVSANPPNSSARSSRNSSSIIKQRLDDYNARVTGISRLDRERTVPALALRSFHLPNNSWSEDWLQYFQNNHPVFGICCHHRLHPVRFRMRLVILLGSVAFGLVVTNIIWLWFQSHEDETYFVASFGKNSSDANNNSTTVTTNTSSHTTGTDDNYTYEVTKGMIVLWTIGGGLHAFFDTTVWFLTACVCCLPGQPLSHLEKYRKFGSYFVVLAVVLCTALSTFVVVIRAVVGEEDEVALEDVPTAGLLDDAIDLTEAKEPSAYRFLIAYAIELALALFVYYPLFVTVLFSGIIGCGRIPILGGRPYELACEKQQLEAERQEQQQRSMSPSPV